MFSKKQIIDIINYSLHVAHISYENKNYYGELSGYYENNKITIIIEDLLLPVEDGLWKITKKNSPSFDYDDKNLKIIKIESIEGQNFLGGYCNLGFEFINILSNFDENSFYFMRENGNLNLKKVQDIINAYEKKITNIEIKYKKKISKLKNL